MKKFFLIPLMAMLCTVMAWATDVHVSTFAELKSAVESGSATTIYLDKDIEYRATANNTCINITRDLTIDGQGHTLTGYAGRNNSTNGTLIALNHASTPNTYSIDVTIKNFNIIDEKYRAIETRSNVGSLTLENCYIEATGKSNYQQPLTIGGNQSSAANINIINSEIVAKIYYPIITFNPVNLTITDSRIDGWCSVYFKGPDGSEGAHGSTVVATNSYFNAQNYNKGRTNSFGAFVLEDDNVNITLDNCVVDVTAHDGTGVATQALFLLSDWATDPSLQCRMTIKGSNSHVIGDFILVDWDATVPVQLELQGGSYYGTDFEAALAVEREDESHPVAVATGYHAEALSQGGLDMYRIIKDVEKAGSGDPLYDLNDNVEDEGKGENPVTSFELSTGGLMELDKERDVTTAGYVQVKDNDDTHKGTVVKVGTTDNEDKKVDQTLVINNGLDAQGESQVIVQSGSALIIGEGGVVTEKPENIVIESTEEAQGALLLDPTITVNQNPKLTVKLKTNSKLNQKVTPTRWEYTYQRFAIPVMLATAGYVTNDFNPATHEFFDDEEEKAGFESYVWQWTGSKWENTTWNTLESSIGYQLANNSKNGKVTYTFTGNLIGNTNTDYEFDMKGFKFFGNSYTAPIMIEELLNGFKATYPDVEATVWVYNYDNHGWKPVDLDALTDGFDDVPTTIKSMDGFILNLRSANSGVAGVDYASAIWNNPTINPKASASPAPRRSSASAISNSVVVKVSAANFADDVTLVEREDRDLSFENGADASKFMNESGLNIYAETPAGTLSRVATNDLLGTQITFDAINDEIYTLSFSHVRGGSYALRDNVTGKVIDLIEGETYTFTQAANTSVQNRFEIVASHKMPTAVDNIEASAKAKGIYTILGQYMGETSKWNSLPAGVYVVDGVKVVK